MSSVANAGERKIGLSRKRVDWAEEEAESQQTESNGGGGGGTPASELKGGVGGDSGPLIK